MAPRLVDRRTADRAAAPGILPDGPASPDLKPSSLQLQKFNFLQVCQYNQNVVGNQSKLVTARQFA